jgi:small subunit ribosomal protein S9
MEKETYEGVGKRKTSIAKVFLKTGSGEIKINDKSINQFFQGLEEESVFIKTPFLMVDLIDQYDIIIKVKGGGNSSQLDAIKLGIAKAISSIDENYRQILNQHKLLRRDSRIKERRKYGLKKARKASQYSKR